MKKLLSLLFALVLALTFPMLTQGSDQAGESQTLVAVDDDQNDEDYDEDEDDDEDENKDEDENEDEDKDEDEDEDEDDDDNDDEDEDEDDEDDEEQNPKKMIGECLKNSDSKEEKKECIKKYREEIKKAVKKRVKNKKRNRKEYGEEGEDRPPHRGFPGKNENRDYEDEEDYEREDWSEEDKDGNYEEGREIKDIKKMHMKIMILEKRVKRLEKAIFRLLKEKGGFEEQE